MQTQTMLDRVEALDGLGPYPEPATLLQRLAAARNCALRRYAESESVRSRLTCQRARRRMKTRSGVRLYG
jgi:hypothetical protein